MYIISEKAKFIKKGSLSTTKNNHSQGYEGMEEYLLHLPLVEGSRTLMMPSEPGKQKWLTARVLYRLQLELFNGTSTVHTYSAFCIPEKATTTVFRHGKKLHNKNSRVQVCHPHQYPWLGWQAVIQIEHRGSSQQILWRRSSRTVTTFVGVAA